MKALSFMLKLKVFSHHKKISSLIALLPSHQFPLKIFQFCKNDKEGCNVSSI